MLGFHGAIYVLNSYQDVSLNLFVCILRDFHRYKRFIKEKMFFTKTCLRKTPLSIVSCAHWLTPGTVTVTDLLQLVSWLCYSVPITLLFLYKEYENDMPGYSQENIITRHET